MGTFRWGEVASDEMKSGTVVVTEVRITATTATQRRARWRVGSMNRFVVHIFIILFNSVVLFIGRGQGTHKLIGHVEHRLAAASLACSRFSSAAAAHIRSGNSGSTAAAAAWYTVGWTLMQLQLLDVVREEHARLHYWREYCRPVSQEELSHRRRLRQLHWKQSSRVWNARIRS